MPRNKNNIFNCSPGFLLMNLMTWGVYGIAIFAGLTSAQEKPAAPARKGNELVKADETPLALGSANPNTSLDGVEFERGGVLPTYHVDSKSAEERFIYDHIGIMNEIRGSSNAADKVRKLELLLESKIKYQEYRQETLSHRIEISEDDSQRERLLKEESYVVEDIRLAEIALVEIQKLSSFEDVVINAVFKEKDMNRFVDDIRKDVDSTIKAELRYLHNRLRDEGESDVTNKILAIVAYVGDHYGYQILGVIKEGIDPHKSWMEYVVTAEHSVNIARGGSVER